MQQTKAQRLLGYSSIGQMGLLTIAACAAATARCGERCSLLVIGGLFVNHLLAKVGLFWLAGYVGRERLQDWSVSRDSPVHILMFGILLAAICRTCRRSPVSGRSGNWS